MKKDVYFLIYLITLGVVSRLILHPWNFTAIGAMALFSGSRAFQKRSFYVLPLVSLFISDLVLGFHHLMIFTYSGFLLTGIAAYFLLQKPMPLSERKPVHFLKMFLGYTSVATVGSFIFFAVTNFGVWLGSGFYSQNVSGLIACYVAGIPFLENQILGDLFYTSVILLSIEALNLGPQFLKPVKSNSL